MVVAFSEKSGGILLDTPVDLIDTSQVEEESLVAHEIQKSGVALFEQ